MKKIAFKKDNYILDSDFRDKYASEIFGTELKFIM